ncbi:PilC/PilY family type IV pilus protein [Pseudoalteromonas sp. Cnat2-41]|uniref:pilus assembly protein n=1 Tax=unclassified Pseudoalteromonas TaxID=194690 RepID=UPI001EF77DFE|nr:MULTISPECIES: PilC/PilY family type IV pilus protein [unclassified Pseudoalteromonas]MCF2863164.1 rRNA (guanine-N1)-methyltransferase [Pseudoalteromonas sp. CNAT2-18]MCG7559316.1 rRNA (guanine-N1)-methyltransferase [Pseudoalteromonas sp. CNAT2-18.1]
MKLFKLLVIASLTFSVSKSFGEDIELYVGNKFFTSSGKPQVLIIFDNSASMNGLIETTKSYDPDVTYDVVSSFDNSLNEDFVYFTIGSGVDQQLPRTDSNSDTKRFHSYVNGCDAARESLQQYGFYTGYIREHQYKGNTGSWVDLKDNSGANTISALDCLDDILNENTDNTGLEIKIGGTTYKSGDTELTGLPISGASKSRNDFYTQSSSVTKEQKDKASADFSGGEVVTLYHPNYLRWYHATDKETEVKSKLDVAKESITTVLNATPIVDFGLMVFNLNYPRENTRDGGRVIANFGQSNADIIGEISGIDGETNTPLCETTYEAFRFFAGQSVWYGDDDTNCRRNECGFRYTGNTPAMDLSAVSNSVYKSPFSGGCSKEAYIILITDGVPTVDKAADGLVSSLVSTTNQPDISDPVVTSTTPYNDDTLSTSNYLPNLTHWMHHNDVNTSVDDVQRVSTFTIGFSDGADDAAGLLKEAATATKSNGDKGYFAAQNAIELSQSFGQALAEILKVNTTFTAPAVASNNFDRTQTLDSVYYAMFLPEEGARWSGNLKKLKVDGTKIVDSKGNLAIDGASGSEGNIKDSAVTFWTKDGKADGNEVKKGGVNAVLAGLNSRTIYTDIGAGTGEMPKFTLANALSYAGSQADLGSYLGTPVERLDSLFEWAKGKDVDDDDSDGNTSELRSDIFADPLHSKPLAIAYSDGSIRIAVGTNGGSLHLFKDNGNTIEEEWSFIPYELYPNLTTLRRNIKGEKVYGMDGSPSMYFDDKNENGVVDPSDRVWLFTGMRRGGDSYYAFDISTPSSPKLMWKVDANTTGMEELGQTWSQPRVTFIEKNGTKPVVVVGAGYDINKDADNISPDNSGRGVYILDAQTGDLVWSFTPGANGNGNTTYEGEHSIPGEIALLDSDYDGFTDRLYAADTGGDVWRFDLPTDNPVGSEPWTAVQIADLSITGNERRFFYQPEVARTYFSKVSEYTTIIDEESSTQVVREETPYEAIVLGSGNRAHPLDESENNHLIMLRDENTITQSLRGEDIPAVITMDDLMDITNDPFTAKLNDDSGFVELEKDLAQFSGWKYSLGANEKSLSAAAVVGGVAYFTTFVPSEENDLQQCSLKGGGGSLYAFHLHYGAKVYDQLKFDVGNKVPDTPTLFFTKVDDPDTAEEESESQFILIGAGKGDGEGTLKAKSIEPNGRPGDCGMASCDENPFGFKTHRTYIYKEETID